jgi:hypothetical protein
MKRYHGDHRVEAGFYWTPARWEIITVPREGGVLPGGEEMAYVRLPVTLVMLVGAMLGGGFVIFLPLIGFVIFFGFAGKKLWHLLGRALKPMLTNPAGDPKEEN